MQEDGLHRFTGKVAYILGGGSQGEPGEIGIGRAIAIRLASEGAVVAVVDQHLGRAQETVDMCAQGGYAIAADLVDADACLNAVAEAERYFGRLDVVVCSVGIQGHRGNELEDITLDEWDLANNINVRAHWLTVKAALPGMRNRGAGQFVFVGSVGGSTGAGLYGITKSALVGLARGVATTYDKDGIRSNVVVPGVIMTPMLRASYGGTPTAGLAERMYPMGRAGTPQEVAAAVAYLSSDDSGYVNGHMLVVDGGLTTRRFVAVTEGDLSAMGLSIAPFS